MVIRICNPSTGDGGNQGRWIPESLESIGQVTYSNWETPVRGGDCLKNEVQRIKADSHIDLWPPHVHSCTCAHTYTCTLVRMHAHTCTRHAFPDTFFAVVFRASWLWLLLPPLLPVSSRPSSPHPQIYSSVALQGRAGLLETDSNWTQWD